MFEHLPAFFPFSFTKFPRFYIHKFTIDHQKQKSTKIKNQQKSKINKNQKSKALQIITFPPLTSVWPAP